MSVKMLSSVRLASLRDRKKRGSSLLFYFRFQALKIGVDRTAAA